MEINEVDEFYDLIVSTHRTLKEMDEQHTRDHKASRFLKILNEKFNSKHGDVLCFCFCVKNYQEKLKRKRKLFKNKTMKRNY